jgi:hypothetical protein
MDRWFSARCRTPLEDVMTYAMSKQAGLGLGLLVALAGGVGCEDEDDLPEVSITSPNAGTVHDLSDDAHVRVSFQTDDFEIEQDCGEEHFCGRAFLNIDGGACNQPGQEYNNVLLDADVAETRTMDALFDQCPEATRYGSHTLTISLRFNDGTQVFGEAGLPVSATITVNTTP